MPFSLKMNVLRQRKQALKIVKELDAFPKVPESYKETTASGGGGKCLFLFKCLLGKLKCPGKIIKHPFYTFRLTM